ncbi:MAG: hypothetical protein PHD48_07220 [Alphaproteobacteria bacterium]|nr:hypothetical protein [Alphaproteobacteria bacterium]
MARPGPSDRTLSPHLLRSARLVIAQIKTPEVKRIALKVVHQFNLIAHYDPQFSFSVRLGKGGTCAAVLTNQANPISPARWNYVDINEQAVFIAYGPNGSCSGKGSDPEVALFIVGVIYPRLPIAERTRKKASLISYKISIRFRSRCQLG